ncbi:hypothetical protein [Nocardioides immobilis]|uniref:hypothetical protein n=1 Tax=Nocardioides immobilis TaxID=2049295 RepID=UPI0015FD2EB2|nr:hypothetical protein [Nocardioides immobilis]
MHATRRVRHQALRSAAAIAVVLLATACVDDVDDPEEAEDPGGASESSIESPGEYTCLLSPEEVTEIIDFDVTGVEPGGEDVETSGGSLVWEGCEFETDSDATVELSTIVDESGEPDVASYDAFAASGDVVPVDGVGDSAVRFRGSLFVKSGDTAYVVSGDNQHGEPLELEVLEELAAAVINAA